MRFNIFAAVLLAAVAFRASAQSAFDKKNITSAQAALDEKGGCDAALWHLRLVSDSAKTTAEYLLATARAYDCKKDKAKAISYYSKYLEKNSASDSARRRIDTLRDSAYVNQQVQKAKNFYKGAKTGFGGPCIRERDFCFGLAGDYFIASAEKKPYKQSYKFFNVYEYPFAKKHMMFDIWSDIGLLLSGSKPWVAKVFNTTPAEVQKVRGTVQINMHLSFKAVIVNNAKYSIAAGPIIGFNAYLNNDPDIESVSGYSSPAAFTGVTGLRGNLYVGRHFYCTAAYIHSLRKHYFNELQYSTTETPTNFSSICLGIGVRGYGFPANSYHYTRW